MHIFPYSPRKGTPAASYPLQVPEEEKKQRIQMMQELADKKAAAFQDRFISRSLSVLFEPEHDGAAQGLTSNYIRVYTNGNSELQGELCTVRLEKTYRDGLWGTIVN